MTALASPRSLAERLATARTQLVDAKLELSSVMDDVQQLPEQLKTSVVLIIEGASRRVREAEQAVSDADALVVDVHPRAPLPVAASQPQAVAAGPGWREHAGMIVFGLMCVGAGVVHLAVGW